MAQQYILFYPGIKLPFRPVPQTKVGALQSVVANALGSILAALLASAFVAEPAAAQVIRPYPAPRPEPGQSPTPAPPHTENNISRAVQEANEAAARAIEAQKAANDLAGAANPPGRVYGSTDAASKATSEAAQRMKTVERLLEDRLKVLRADIQQLQNRPGGRIGPGERAQIRGKQEMLAKLQAIADDWLHLASAWTDATTAWTKGAADLRNSKAAKTELGGSMGAHSGPGGEIAGVAAIIATGTSAALLTNPPKPKPVSP